MYSPNSEFTKRAEIVLLSSYHHHNHDKYVIDEIKLMIVLSTVTETREYILPKKWL